MSRSDRDEERAAAAGAGEAGPLRQDGEEDATGGRSRSAAVWALLWIVGLAGLGLGVIKVVDALEADADCGSYGYGGYGNNGGYGGYGCPPTRGDAAITVDPATGLVDRQTVTVRGVRFDPNTLFGAALCDARLVGELQSADACDLETVSTGRTGSDGTATLTMTVRRIILVQGVEVDCAVAGACILGAATIPDGFNPTESASSSIQFDPNVPPIPRLTVELTVDTITRYAVSGTATCNHDAELYANAFVQQTRGRREILASGFAEGSSCGPTPAPWSAILFESSGRLGGGTVEYEVFGYAYDGFDIADVNASGEIRLSPGGPPPIEPVDEPGTTVSVSISGSSGSGAEQTIDLVVACGRPVDTGYASVVVSQWAGTNRVEGYGSVEFGPCNGATPVSVPVGAQTGTLSGGPAEVRASVYIHDIGPNGEPFSDSASVVDAVRLRGLNRPALVVEPNPGSRITITAATRSQISGTVRCAEPLTVSLWTEAQQNPGRDVTRTYGNGEIACNGVTDFTLDLESDLGPGTAAVAAYGTAARVVEGSPINEYVWDDYQGAEIRVGR